MSVRAMEWRRCPRFPDYDVSDCGDVRRALHAPSQPGRRLNGTIDGDGYIRFHIRDAFGERAWAGAHQLVAEAFVGPAPSPAHEIAHGNGSRVLNIPGNLRWALPVENHADRAQHGTAPQGGANGRATITDDDVRYIRRRYRELKLARLSPAELDKKFNLHRSQIIRIARGQAWSHVK